MSLIRDLRYRIAARLLGETWHIPSSANHRAYIVMTTADLCATFPVSTLHLELTHQIPPLGDAPIHERLRQSGTFSGTIGDDE
jgi:hypothetical protein